MPNRYYAGFNQGVVCEDNSAAGPLTYGARVCDTGSSPLAVRICNKASCTKDAAGWAVLP